MQIVEYLKSMHNISLNEQQVQAIYANNKNVLLLAVPGSGKTTVLVGRIAYLILEKNINPNNILTLTFSRESAKDMKARFESLFSNIVCTIPKFSTIHSFCYTVLKEYSKMYNKTMPQLIDGNTNLRINKSIMLRQIYKQVKQEYLTDDMLENIANDISYYKNMMLNKDNYDKHIDSDESFIEIIEEYERIKKEHKLMDYDDILIYALDLLKKLPKLLNIFKARYKYINLDEAQDTSKIQYHLLDLFSDDAKFFIVGDEDQCIYMFRGAYPDGLLNFSKNYNDTKVLKIEQNYRSNSDIVKKANDFIKINKNRYSKEMFTLNKKVDSIELVELSDYNKQYKRVINDITRLAKNKTVGILYRNNESAIPLIDRLMDNKIDYYIKEKSIKFFSSSVVRDIFAYFTLAYEPKNIDAFEKIYYKCKCNKSILIFVKHRINDFESVFQAGANCPDISEYQVKYLQQCHRIITKLKDKMPFYAIQKIENDLGYKQYLHMRVKRGINPLNHILKLNILKSLAKRHKTIKDFVQSSLILEENIANSKDNNSNIMLTSIHSSKGLEFDIVYFIDFIDSIIPTISAIESASEDVFDEMESEARLFYVALTRAKEKVVIYTSKFCNDEYVVKSRFITRIQDKAKIKEKQKNKEKIKLKGKIINHSKFGEGVILTDSINGIFKVQFKNFGQKHLSYDFCIENGELKDLK